MFKIVPTLYIEKGFIENPKDFDFFDIGVNYQNYEKTTVNQLFSDVIKSNPDEVDLVEFYGFVKDNFSEFEGVVYFEAFDTIIYFGIDTSV